MFRVEIEKATVSVTMSRPPVNAINEEWIEGVDHVLDECEQRDDIRVLRFASALKVFCAGAEIDMLVDRLSTQDGIRKMVADVRRMQALYTRLEQSPLVSIAEINGAALGGGFELSLACDFRVAAETAKVGLPEARLGLLAAAGGTQRLTKMFGAALARRLLLGAEVLDGTEAARLGLVHWAYPGAQLAEKTQQLVRRLEELPKPALRANKRCIFASQERAGDAAEVEIEGTTACYQSAEAMDRLKAFLAKKGGSGS